MLGRHRLLCGDSADPSMVQLLLGDKTVHLVNTDPPYNVRVEPRSNNAIASGISTKGDVPNPRRAKTHHQQLDLARHPEKAKPTGKMRAKDRPLENDFVSDEAFAAMLQAWFGNLSQRRSTTRSGENVRVQLRVGPVPHHTRLAPGSPLHDWPARNPPSGEAGHRSQPDVGRVRQRLAGRGREEAVTGGSPKGS